MRSQLLKPNTKTLTRSKRRRQRLKSWPITFSPFARSRALALPRTLKRHSQNPNSALPAKEPQPSHSSHRHLDGVDGEDFSKPEHSESSDEDFDGVVQADFSFFDPKPDDFHGVKTLLQTYLDDEEWDLSAFVELILGQTTVGTVVKIEDDEDEGIFALVTALNFYRYREHRCIVALKDFLLHKAHQEKGVADKLKLLLGEQARDVALLVSQRMVNLPPQLLQKLYPDAKVTIGPWIENGFYYDFDMEPLTDKDLKRIKKEMDRIIGRNLPLLREEVSRDEAHKRILALNEPYKLEILESIKEDAITIYHIGDEWWDLCAGPHVESTGNINKKAVELESIAGAYWRGDEKKPMLQRIYGTAWENEEQLKAYLHFKEEAKRRDHRRIGQDLDLFSIQDDAGGGLVFWHPKGALVRHIIEDFWKNIHLKCGYDLLYTPHVAKADLWKISGHLDFYKENMYDQMNIEDELYQLRPMNCPYHILVYKSKLHSYRDFPIRVAELGTVYRYELSGSLHGLFRVRGFTQDDAHIFCLDDQIKDEIRGVLDLTEQILLQFGFDKYEVNLSTRPEKAVGDDDIWEKATSALEDALDDKGWSYQIDDGGGAFYGPKIDIKIEDALGRKWQCSTIQVDFNLPQRFDITYVDSNTEKRRPIMIHRAVLGSLERFFGVLIEHYAGDFPLWLSPIQARVLPVTDAQLEYCNGVAKKLKSYGIRVEVCHGERLPKLIRNAEKQKIPLMAVVGSKEVETETVTVRSRFGGELGTMSVDDFINRIKLASENLTSL